MQTDPDYYDERPFHVDAARHASLCATLSRVRLRRRMRKTGGAIAVLCLTALLVRLAIPGAVTPPGGQVVERDQLIIRSAPLKADQRMVSVKDEGMFVRTTATEAVARVKTPADAPVARLGDSEFRHLLAAHDVYCIQVGAGAAQVLPLHAE